MQMQTKIHCLLLCTLAVPILAVINGNSKAERREAPFDTYGPPVHGPSQLPAPIYGAPGSIKYPAPPPDIPPPPPQGIPHQEYGVPVQKYGPPKVRIH